MLKLLNETPIEVTQDGWNWVTNKLVASVKYLWFQATPLAVDLGVVRKYVTSKQGNDDLYFVLTVIFILFAFYSFLC